jgi:tellurite methyltransferase
MEGRFTSRGGRRFALPDGTERFLVDEPYLLELTSDLGGALLDPLKTTVVQDRRCMTTWVMRRVA